MNCIKNISLIILGACSPVMHGADHPMPARLAHLLSSADKPFIIGVATPASVGATLAEAAARQSYIDNPPLMLNPNPPLGDEERQMLWELATHPDVIHFLGKPETKISDALPETYTLIKRTAKLARRDYRQDGESVLAYAARKGFLDVAKVLIAAYAPLDIPNKRGHTPLDIALIKCIATAPNDLPFKEIASLLCVKQEQRSTLPAIECPICFNEAHVLPLPCPNGHRICLNCLGNMETSEVNRIEEAITPGVIAVYADKTKICPFCRAPYSDNHLYK